MHGLPGKDGTKCTPAPSGHSHVNEEAVGPKRQGSIVDVDRILKGRMARWRDGFV